MELCMIIVLQFMGLVGREKCWNKASKLSAEVGLTENVKVRLTIGLGDSARVNPEAPKFDEIPLIEQDDSEERVNPRHSLCRPKSIDLREPCTSRA